MKKISDIFLTKIKVSSKLNISFLIKQYYYFCNSSDPKKRFQLFLKATQMDVILEKLEACSKQISKAKAQLQLQVKVSETLKEAKEKAERKFMQFQSVERFKVSHLAHTNESDYLKFSKFCL